MMDELVDILDPEGNFVHKVALKSIAHRDGLFHNTVHIWFYTPDGKLLLQQRGKNKKTFPLLWDVSVAGHVGAGETIELSALREVEEEIGVIIAATDLQKIGVFKSEQEHPNGIKDREFHHTFLCALPVPVHKLHPQESEVEALKLVELNAFATDVIKPGNSEKYVPHAINYYRDVVAAISQRL